jgi:hypothetical protein
LAAVSVLPSRTKVTKVRTEMRTGVVAHRYTHSASRYFLPNHTTQYSFFYLVSGLKSKDYKERCLELGLDTLEKRREEQDMALVHKMALGGQLSKVFEMADAHYRPRIRQTEGEYRLIQKFAWTDPRKYSFAVRVVDPWNKLPDDLKLANSKEQFKAKMKRVKM